MHSPSSPRASRLVQKLAALALLVAALLVSIGSVQAQPASLDQSGRARDPNTSVSSDGSSPRASAEGVIESQGGSYVASFKGTGAVVNGGKGTAHDQVVPPVFAPGQEVGIESVIGADGRFQITNTTAYPYRAIAHVTSSIGGCTGWLINANTVVTAGHCVYGSGWASNVRVYPGRNGSSTPYGSCGARLLYSVVGWTQNHDRNYDYGAIKLNCSIGNTTGWFGYRWQSASLTGQPTYLAGYPGDKAYGTMWRHNDVVRITQTYRLYYANDTYGGQSGSPVWNGQSGCSPCGIAIHAYGVDSTGFNGGTRITQSVFNNLTNWKNS